MATQFFGILFWGWFWRGETRHDSNQWGLDLEGGQQQRKSGHGPRKVAGVTFCAFDLRFSFRWYITIAGEAMRKVEQFRHGIYYQIGNILTAFPFNAIAFSTIYLLMMPLTARFLQNFDVANFQRLNWPGWCLQHGWDHSMISYCKLYKTVCNSFGVVQLLQINPLALQGPEQNSRWQVYGNGAQLRDDNAARIQSL